MARGMIGWILDRVAPGLFKTNKDFESIFNTLSKSVKGLTRQFFGGWFRGWDKAESVKGMDFKSTIYAKFPRWAMIESENKLARRYLNTFKITGIDRFTGEATETFHKHYFMKWKGQEEWEADAYKAYMRKQDTYALTNITVQLWTVEHKRDWTY